MNNEERDVLKKVLDNPSGLLSQSDLLNLLPDRNTKISHSLITSGHIEEVVRRIKATQIEATFYRITEKGRAAFDPLYLKIWKFFRDTNNLSTVLSIIATILSIVATIIALQK